MPDTYKPPLADDTVQQLREAWDNRAQIAKSAGRPVADVEDAIRKVHQTFVEHYDVPIDPENRPLNQLGRGMLNVADYGAGMIRTGSMDAASRLAGRPSLVTGQDYKDALNPFDGKSAPPVDEYLKRAGIPEGGRVSDYVPGYAKPGPNTPWYQPEKGGLLDPTIRGAAGFVGDVALSPGGVGAGTNVVKKLSGNTEEQLLRKMSAPEVLRYLRDKANGAAQSGPMQKAAGAAKVVLDPAGTILGAGGRKVYDSAWNKMDQDAARVGGVTAQMPSEVGWKNNIWGTAPSVETQAGDQIRKIGADVANDLAEHDRMYPLETVNKGEARVGAKNYLADRMAPGTQDAAEKASDVLKSMWKPARGQHEFSASEANRIKGAFQDLAAGQKGGYDDVPIRPGKALKAGMNEVQSEVLGNAYAKSAQGLREGIESALDTAEPGTGGQVMLKNRDAGALQGAMPVLKKASNQAGWKTAQDALVGGAIGTGAAGTAALFNGGIDPKVAALLALLGGASTTTVAKTGAGLLAGKAGAPLANLARAGAMERTGEASRQPSPWEALSQEIEAAKAKGASQ